MPFHGFAVGESINIDSVVLVVEAVEKASVQERNGPIGQLHEKLWILEHGLIAHELVVVIIAAAVSEMPL